MNFLHKIASAAGYQLLKRDAIVYHSTARGLYLSALGREPETIFDVGANLGQTSAGYREAFPGATIHAFEPFPENFQAVEDRFTSDPKTSAHRIALSSEAKKEAVFYLAHSCEEHSLKPPPSDRAAGETVTVPVSTLDGFCEENGIHKIDILKTDTEGMEIEVLKGGGRLLEEARIGCVLAEVGFGGDDELHLTTAEIGDFLEDKGFSFFGYYDLGYLSGRLHFANALFIHSDA